MKRFIISIIAILFVIIPNKAGATIPGIERYNLQGNLQKLINRKT
ncbi:hypothetical protein ABES02_20145 [Neobacillus pocheonensis]